jgi:hypothetical protein
MTDRAGRCLGRRNTLRKTLRRSVARRTELESLGIIPAVLTIKSVKFPGHRRRDRPVRLECGRRADRAACLGIARACGSENLCHDFGIGELCLRTNRETDGSFRC